MSLRTQVPEKFDVEYLLRVILPALIAWVI